MTSKRTIEKLDKISGIQQNFQENGDVLDLMEKVASDKSGLEILINRYSSSANPIMLRSIAFLLTGFADSDSEEALLLVIKVINKMATISDDSTLINLLTAIQRAATSNALNNLNQDERNDLFRFIIYCMEKSDFAKRGAIASLYNIQENVGLESFFTNQQTRLLRNILFAIRSISNEMLELELESLRDFMGKFNT